MAAKLMPTYELKFVITSADEPSIKQIAEALAEAYERAKLVSMDRKVLKTTITHYTVKELP